MCKVSLYPEEGGKQTVWVKKTRAVENRDAWETGVDPENLEATIARLVAQVKGSTQLPLPGQ